jgi:hypothetical protein
LWSARRSLLRQIRPQLPFRTSLPLSSSSRRPPSPPPARSLLILLWPVCSN